MKRPARSCKIASAVAVLVLLVSMFSKNASANTTPKFVYVANSGNAQGVGGSISGYAINATTGALTPVAGSPLAAGTGPSAVAADPSNKFLYVANKFSNNVSAFTVDASTGALTPVAGSPFATGTAPVAMAVDPLGTFVYVVNQTSNTLSVFTLNSQTGR